MTELAKERRRNAEVRKRKKLLGTSLALTGRYTTDSYCKAIREACGRVGVKWTPNQLRHSRLTEVRDLHGLDAAQEIGGHEQASTTERYAKTREAKADRAAMADG